MKENERLSFIANAVANATTKIDSKFTDLFDELKAE